MTTFKREDNYNDDLLKIANDLLEAGILIVPNKDCLKGYYNGLVLINRLTERSFNLIGNEKAINNYIDKDEIKKNDKLKNLLSNYKSIRKNKDFDFEKKITSFKKNIEEWFEILNYGMPRDQERKTSQIIALNNMTFEDDKYSVCGWETTIGKNDSGADVKPEIDLVVVNPSKKEMILVEYKCQKKSMLGQKQNIFAHWKDYMQICESKNMPEIKNRLLRAFNVYRRMKKLEPIPEEVFEEFQVKVGFLFVDRTYDNNGKLVSFITDKDYDEGMRLFKSRLLPHTKKMQLKNIRQPFKVKFSMFDLKKTLYIRAKTADNLILDNWKKVEDGFFRNI